MIKNCPMRHENGNCIPAGGFCTANKNICEALLNAYRMGKAQLSQEGTTKDATSDLISRQQTLDALIGAVKKVGILDADDIKAVFDMLPTIQPIATDTNVGDTISRQATIDAIHCNIVVTGRENAELVAKTMGEFVDRIKALPTVQPEPHEGRFERKQDGVFCSVCHYGWEFITGVPAEVEREYHYCPNCGADMRGEKDG